MTRVIHVIYTHFFLMAQLNKDVDLQACQSQPVVCKLMILSSLTAGFNTLRSLG